MMGPYFTESSLALLPRVEIQQELEKEGNLYMETHLK